MSRFVAVATLHYAFAQKTSASLQGLGPTDVFCAKAGVQRSGSIGFWFCLCESAATAKGFYLRESEAAAATAAATAGCWSRRRYHRT
ncbi:hypothetical protein ABE61_20140 [Lysinibacillus sphaericus]|nr:hypothetical protein [Lysinibacillus sphaericus]MBG9479266.1 hypothetical protein [Lysinibacillus sphaericus]MBG9594511.1 hypothetical protein [Lysinibacillus sphaericus]